MGRVILLIITTLLILAGCGASKQTEYVSVSMPEYHEHTESNKDSVHVTDSVSDTTTTLLLEVDSSYLANIGIINPPKKAWLLQKNHSRERKSKLTNIKNDSVAKIDTVPIPVPYPVTKIEKVNEFYWWQKLYIWIVSLFSAYCLVYAIIDIYKLKHRNS